MIAINRDKAFARRMSAAGCLRALGIVRVRCDVDDTRVLRPDERAIAWRIRASMPGLHNHIFPLRVAETPHGAVHASPEGSRVSGTDMPAGVRQPHMAVSPAALTPAGATKDQT